MALPIRVQRGERNDPFELMRRDFSDMLGRFFGDEQEGGRLAPFGVDVREDRDHIYVEADLPGFRKEDVDITLEGGMLTISAEKRHEQEEPAQHKGRSAQPASQQAEQRHKGHYLLRERRYERFFRSFTLPGNVDEQQVDAKLKDGCLIITLTKREESKPRRIDVS